MKNYEVYGDKIREFKGSNFCKDFVIPNIFKSDNCDEMSCSYCGRYQLLWLLDNYEEPQIDWSKVEVNTPILVSNSEDGDWYKRYFAKYKNGKVFAWRDGRTSWNETDVRAWDFAKLAKNEEE